MLQRSSWFLSPRRPPAWQRLLQGPLVSQQYVVAFQFRAAYATVSAWSWLRVRRLLTSNHMSTSLHSGSNQLYILYYFDNVTMKISLLSANDMICIDAFLGPSITEDDQMWYIHLSHESMFTVFCVFRRSMGKWATFQQFTFQPLCNNNYMNHARGAFKLRETMMQLTNQRELLFAITSVSAH